VSFGCRFDAFPNPFCSAPAISASALRAILAWLPHRCNGGFAQGLMTVPCGDFARAMAGFEHLSAGGLA
jgi:hypothetical protein